MSKSNIVLAILAGAVIGGAVAIVLKAQSALEPQEDEAEEEPVANANLENIARQFSDRISSELRTAEGKLHSAVKKKSDHSMPDGEFGVFL